MTPTMVNNIANDAQRILSTANVGASQIGRLGDAIEVLRAHAVASCPPAVPATPTDQPPLSALATLTRQRDGWRHEADMLRRRLLFAESDIDVRAKHQASDVWYYQGDGYDHLESMGNGMVVVIHAAELRALLATNNTPAADHTSPHQ